MADEPTLLADTDAQSDGAALARGTLADRDLGEQPPPAISVGDRFAQYHVLKELGAGAMGTVVEAYDERLDRRVALKVLHNRGKGSEEKRLLREAQALARLSHPNVVQVYEVGQAGSRLFIAMELVVGDTLKQWQEQDHGWREIVEAYLQAGHGLVGAHAEGLIHRDFKPSNCIIDANGRVKVLDFGLARASDDAEGDTTTSNSYAAFLEELASSEHSQSNRALRQALTRTGAVLGTPAYMAPEQLRGRAASVHSDQFNFCVALYEGLYGRRPFRHASIGELISAVIGGDILPPPSDTTVPKAAWSILQRGLHADPDKRWPTLPALLDELTKLLAPPSRGRWVAGLALVAATAAGVVVATHDSDPPCQGGEARLAEVWGPAQRTAIDEALSSSGLAFATHTRDRVLKRIDEYGQRWAEHHTNICEATHVHREQSEQTMELRMRCMEQQRSALRNTVELLSQADDAMVEHAIGMVRSLPDPHLCDNVSVLESALAVDPSSANAEAIAGLRDEFSEIEALIRADRESEAFEDAQSLVERAQALDFAPVLVDAYYFRGVLRKHAGRFADAKADLLAAFELAIEIGYDMRAADASQELTFVIGNELGKREVGSAWGAVAEATARRIGPDSLEHANALRSSAITWIMQGEIDEAAKRFEHALRIAQNTPDAPDLLLARALGDMGNLEMSRGALPAARDYYERSLQIRAEVFGQGHPARNIDELNLARLAEAEGNLDEATDRYRRALELLEGRNQPNHPENAIALNNLAVVYDKQGEPKLALQMHRRALEIREHALGPEHPFVGHSHVNIGLALRAMGDLEQSLDHITRGYEIAQKVGGSDLEHTLFELSEAELKLGQLDTARAKRERYLTLVQAHEDANSPGLAFAEFGLAKVQWEQGEHDDARALVAQALRRTVAAGPAADKLRLDIEEWQRQHRPLGGPAKEQ